MNGLKSILSFSSRTHRPCLSLALVLALGVVMGRYAGLDWTGWAFMAVVSLVVALFIARAHRAFLYLALLSLGAFSYQNTYLLPEDHIAWLRPAQYMKVTAAVGVIDSDVQLKPAGLKSSKQVFEMRLDALRVLGRWRPVKGRVLVHCFAGKPLRYGDHLIAEGRIYKAVQELQGGFRYRQYLEEQGIFFNLSIASKSKVRVIVAERGHLIRGYAITFKHRCQEVFKRFLTPLETGVIQAMIVGDRSLMDKGLYALFQRTGTAHILAISGMNMAIITAMVLFFLRVIIPWRPLQMALAVVFLLFYALLSGWSASVVRAVFMAVVMLLAYVVEEEADAVNSLGLAAFILLVIFPGTLFDTGFQLSVVCVGGILLGYPLIAKRIEAIELGWFRRILQAGAVSLIAWGVSWPIIAWRFEMITPIAVLANIPVVALADVTVCLGLVLVLAGIVCPLLAFAVAGALELAFHLMRWVTMFFAAVPAGSMPISGVEFFHVFCYYLLLMIVYLVVNVNGCRNPQDERKML